jgi:hypothetical protein
VENSFLDGQLLKNGCVQVPDKAIQEYSLLVDDKLILISGSKSSGGLAVSRPG